MASTCNETGRCPLFEHLEPRLLLDGTAQLFSALPATFIANAGQWDASVRYAALSSDGNVLHTTSGPAIQRFGNDAGATVSLQFDGAEAVNPVGRDLAGGRFNFYIGDPSNWVSGVTGYEAVAYDGLYEGIDLLTWGRPGGLKYEFRVAGGADPDSIQMTFAGADELYLKDGDLHVATSLGELVDDKPAAWQVKPNGKQRNLKARYVLLDADTVAFKLRRNALLGLDVVIDPHVGWSTYVGGSGLDGANAVAVDGSDNILVGGDTGANSWVSGGYDTTHGGSSHEDGFVAKLTTNGQHLWSTFLGGSSTDIVDSIAADGSDNVLAVGNTRSAGWVSGGYDTTHGGGSVEDGFDVKLNADGQHVWSTYLGGSSQDYGGGLAVDGSDNVLAAGYTRSAGWVSGGYDTSYDAQENSFAVKLTSAGAHVWSTYLGGSTAADVAVDGSGSAYVSGTTNDDGWTSGGFDTTYNGGPWDAYVVKISNAGWHVWSTYLGGSGGDRGFAVAIDGASNVLVTGETTSSSWVSGGYDTSFGGGQDSYVAKLTNAGAHSWSTYVGGAESDLTTGIAVDGSNGVLVVGRTDSPDWATGGFDIEYNGGTDAFVTALTSAGAHQWSSYMGGKEREAGGGVAVDGAGNILVAGETRSEKWIAGGPDTEYGGLQDGFVAKINAADGVDLVGMIDSRKLPSSVTPGDRKLGLLKKVLSPVANQGNRAAPKGTMTLDLYASADRALDGGDQLLASVTVKVKAKPGKTKKYKFKKVVCPVLAAGDYYLLAVVDSGGNIAEHNETNNIALCDRTVEWL